MNIYNEMSILTSQCLFFEMRSRKDINIQIIIHIAVINLTIVYYKSFLVMFVARDARILCHFVFFSLYAFVKCYKVIYYLSRVNEIS